jgi:hypothetical protein
MSADGWMVALAVSALLAFEFAVLHWLMEVAACAGRAVEWLLTALDPSLAEEDVE